MVMSGIKVDGPAGSTVSAKATFRGLEAKLPGIPIVAPFIMDAKFDAGAPSSLTGQPDTYQFMSFPFSLAHATGSAAGRKASAMTSRSMVFAGKGSLRRI